MTIYRADIVATARSMCEDKATKRPGVRWRHQGITRRGVDCIGLIGLVAAELGLTDAWLTDASLEFKGYGRSPNAPLIYRACAQYLQPVTPKESALPGDILLLRFEQEPQHFAFLSALDPPYMIHAYAQARRVAENRIDEKWRSRIICAYQFPGVE